MEKEIIRPKLNKDLVRVLKIIAIDREKSLKDLTKIDLIEFFSKEFKIFYRR